MFSGKIRKSFTAAFLSSIIFATLLGLHSQSAAADSTSPYFTMTLMQNEVTAIKGQVVEIPMRIDFFNGFSTAGGISFFTTEVETGLTFPGGPGMFPDRIMSSGGVIVRIETSVLEPRTYNGEIQSHEAQSVSQSVPFTLNVVTVTDIKFFEYDTSNPPQKQYITSKTVNYQGQFGEQNGISYEVHTSDGKIMDNAKSGVRLTSTDPSVVGAYRRYWGYDLWALGNGPTDSATLRATAPDGTVRELPVTVAIPAGAPRIVSIGVFPSDVSNKGTQTITFQATGDTDNWISSIGADMSGYTNLSFGLLNKPVYNPPSVTSEFAMNNPPTDIGTAILKATASRTGYSGVSTAAVPMTTYNDFSYAGMRFAFRSLDSSIFGGEMVNIEFYAPDNTATPLFTRPVWSMYLGEGTTIDVGGITPGIFKIRFVPSMNTIQPRWWPNAMDGNSAQALTFTAGQYVNNIFFFALPVPTLTFSGSVKEAANAPTVPVSGALVEYNGSSYLPPVNTDDGGNFVLSGIPQGQNFDLKISKDGFTPVYSEIFNWTADIQTLLSYGLFPSGTLGAWGVAAGNGAIIGRVTQLANPTGYLSGATVTAVNADNPSISYPVTYQNADGTAFGGTATSTNGVFAVLNVPGGVTVQITASLAGWTFPTPSRWLTVRDGAISESSFFGTPPPTISFSGYVMDNATTPSPIGGATIERAGAIPPNATTSNTDGSYTLTGLPAGTAFHLKFTKDGFAPTYTANMSSTVNIVNTVDQSFNLFPANQLATWVIDAGKGIIRTRVRDQARTPIGGVVISATSQLGQTYQICYDDACTPTLTATEATSGRYIVRNVWPGDLVTVTATKAGWTFGSRTYRTYAGGISQGGITGAGQDPVGDELAIRDGLANAVAAINAGNLTGFMAYVSDNYLDDGENKAAFQTNVEGLIAAGGQLAYALGTITIQGDMATVPVTWTFTIGGQQEVDGETLIFKYTFENSTWQWRIYGNRQSHEVRVTSQHWASGYHASFTVEDPSQQITAVTVTGPGITTPLSLTSHTENWDGQPVNVWWNISGSPFIGTAIPATPPTYTITVTEPTGNTEYTRTISGWMQDFATNLSPVGTAGGPVIFTWMGITGATKYDVELNEGIGFNRIWSTYDNDGDHIPPTHPWAVYDGAPLVQGNTYRYWVVTRDANDNSSFAEGQFTYSGSAGISYTGQVTVASDGAALSGVSVAMDGNPALSSTTVGSGFFTLSGLPAGSNFAVKMAKEGFRPTYTALLRSQSNFTHNTAYSLFTPMDDTASWPVNFDVKGAIATRVVDSAGNYIAGARVSAQSLLHPSVSYAVTYRDDAGNFGGSSTYANGRFYVLGVDEGDIVTVTAAKSGYNSQSRSYLTHAGGISQGRITLATLAGTITFSAKVTDAAGQPISGVAVQVAGNPAIVTYTNHDGGFTLAGIPANTPFTLMFSKTGYVTSYSALQQSGGSPLTSVRPFILFAQTDLTAWGITAGKGVIIGRIMDSVNPETGFVTGARVTAAGALKGYTVAYLDNNRSIVSGASSTQANGLFLVLDVDDGDTVQVMASKYDWIFQPRTFRTHANAVSIGSIFGVYNPFLKGDIDGNRVVNLADAILALQVVSGMQPAGIRTDYATSGTDVNGDGKVGVAEVIHILQVLSGLRVDPFSQLEQDAVAGINASLAIFKETWNQYGTNYDYLPYFHINYLNDGLNRIQAAQNDMPPAGFNITSYAVHSVVSFDAAQKIITVEISYAGTNNSVLESGIDTETFAYDASSGKWLRYGNQRIGEFSVWLGKSRTMPAVGQTSDKFIAHFHLKAAKNTVTQVVVNGPVGWMQIFANRQPWFDDPDNFDGFYTYTGGMDVDITRTPQTDDVYTFTAYKAGGTVTYTQTIQSVLTEAPTVTSPASHSLAGLAGNRLNITWTLPDPGIQMDNIRIESNFMGLAGSVEGVVTSPTGGHIDIPANATGGYIDVRIHHQGEIFTNCRFEFGP